MTHPPMGPRPAAAQRRQVDRLGNIGRWFVQLDREGKPLHVAEGVEPLLLKADPNGDEVVAVVRADTHRGAVEEHRSTLRLIIKAGDAADPAHALAMLVSLAREELDALGGSR